MKPLYVPQPPTNQVVSVPKPPTQPQSNATSTRIVWDKDGEKDNTRLNLFSVLKKSSPSGNREGLKLLQQIQNPHKITTYPKKCRTDEQKFFHLSSLFLKEQIDRPTYLEFADVLKFQTNLDKEEKLQDILITKAQWELKKLLESDRK